MTEDTKKENQNQDMEKDPETIGPERRPDIVDPIRIECFDIAQEYINELSDPEELLNNNGLFVDMLKYIYNAYIGDVIGNKHNNYNFRYDYELLNRIFYIYTSLVYRYKQNKRPSILEFTLFVHMDRQTLYNVLHGATKNVTPGTVGMIKSWFTECENQLTNGSSVFEIFLLKSQYRYNDNLSPIPIESQGPALGINELPDLNIAKIAKKDTDTGKSKT